MVQPHSCDAVRFRTPLRVNAFLSIAVPRCASTRRKTTEVGRAWHEAWVEIATSLLLQYRFAFAKHTSSSSRSNDPHNDALHPHNDALHSTTTIVINKGLF